MIEQDLKPCGFTHRPNGSEHVENKASIEAWRTEKSRLDGASSVHEIVGCVGEPLADAIVQVFEAIDVPLHLREAIVDAATEARSNLLDWTNEHRQEGYQQGMSDAGALAGQTDPADVLDGVELDSCTLAEACEHTRDHIERQLEYPCDYGWSAMELSDSDLT